MLTIISKLNHCDRRIPRLRCDSTGYMCQFNTDPQFSRTFGTAPISKNLTVNHGHYFSAFWCLNRAIDQNVGCSRPLLPIPSKADCMTVKEISCQNATVLISTDVKFIAADLCDDVMGNPQHAMPNLPMQLGALFFLLNSDGFGEKGEIGSLKVLCESKHCKCLVDPPFICFARFGNKLSQ